MVRGLFFELIGSSEVVIDHCCYTRVAPYVLCRLYHVDDSINGENDAKHRYGSTDARHERQRKEKTPHGNTRIADGRHHRDDHPYDNGGEGERRAAMLHHKQRGDQNKGGTTVHVDRGADGQYKARYLLPHT